MAVVSLSAQQVELLLSLSSLRLIDLTGYLNNLIVIESVEEGCLTETLVSKLAFHGGAMFICSCPLGAGGLLDGVFHMVLPTCDNL